MKITDQVITLQQAKLLKEMGVAQKSAFTWWDTRGVSNSLFHTDPMVEFGQECPGSSTDKGVQEELDACGYSAFTGSEIGELITGTVVGSSYWLRNFHGSNVQLLDGADKITFAGKNEAEARCHLLIHLLHTAPNRLERINQLLNKS